MNKEADVKQTVTEHVSCILRKSVSNSHTRKDFSFPYEEFTTKTLVMQSLQLGL